MTVLTDKDFVGSLATIISIFQFLSGILVCKKYVANKSTGEASPLPFVCGVLSGGVWLLYGLAKDNSTIVLVNVVGCSLLLSYIVVFYLYTFKKILVIKQLSVMACFLLIITTYFKNEKNKEVLLHRIGLLACSITLIAIAAPMDKFFHVLRVKNTECLPFPLIFMTFMVCLLWFFYGVIDEDKFQIIPNSIGAALALFQLSLFLIYPSKPRNQQITKGVIA